jgi:hypothetical protein
MVALSACCLQVGEDDGTFEVFEGVPAVGEGLFSLGQTISASSGGGGVKGFLMMEIWIGSSKDAAWSWTSLISAVSLSGAYMYGVMLE